MFGYRVFQCSQALGVALSLMVCSAAWSADLFKVTNPWVRATVPGQTVAGAYMDIAAQAPGVLVGVESPVAGKVELHTMSMDGGVMKMRQVIRITLPASQTVNLKPGGYHVMLLDLKRQLKAGERVPLALTIRTRQGVKSTLNVDAEVKSVSSASDAHTHH